MIRTVPIRFPSVKGYENRVNDIIYCPPIRNGLNSVVIFFGGDMQDLYENMESHRDAKNYLKYNLEDCTLRLRNKFPDSHLINVRPSKIILKTFSCYSNFVPTGDYGSPEHVSMNFALKHLQKLLQNVSERLNHMKREEFIENTQKYRSDLLKDTEERERILLNYDQNLFGKNLQFENFDLKAIGFSKGCVVLNQFLYEFHYLKTENNDLNLNEFVHRFKDLYWLDGGHSGGKNIWITSKPILDTLSNLELNVQVHVSPYQIEDDRRPWIRKEEKAFSDSLKRLNASIFRRVHFENVQPSLFTHFEVLNAFKEDEDLN
ncbi:mitochondrial protein C2orf69 homolog [Onthophagus taurus]|uniref:mitochondrial protein C2orf69 homolog n=1 Tax=Onthophagus taurus TaxID=166361 RepID=UPI0039BDF66A